MKQVRNVTFSLPTDLLRQAKMLAAEKDVSLNALVKDALVEAVNPSAGYRRAGERLLELAKTPLIRMPDRMWNRSDLYD